ncbi:Putative 2-dehydropantoate 2-reductase [Vanrija pseudolonga]|uniref:2-dehydropantoate 2-reductase n=1 Tax=Vanrija pseudolonga TaxID=143232 RepID=A0AAF1BLK4_9TREE|nr:Putative 2-dehydropantoate 2-reductase [Vanrija pseudolonga]
MTASSSSKPNALLFGLGSIGGVYASILARSGAADTSVVARSNYAAVKDKGFDLQSEKFGDHHLVFDGVYRDTKEAAASGKVFDYVLCANKALLDAKPSLAETLAPVITPNVTSIVLLQNGVGAEAPLHAAFPNTTIISAVVWTGAKVLPASEAGVPRVQQFAREQLTIGVDATPGLDAAVERARLARLVEVLQKGGGTCEVVDDIQSARWIKVVWNCAWNTLTTVTRLRTNHIFGSSPGAAEFAVQLMSEVVAVARAKGLTVPEGTERDLLKQCQAVGGPGLPSSMMFDNEAGRPMEVEVILGTPVREGQRLGVPVPILTTLYTIIKALDWRNANPETAAAPGP